MTEGAAIQQTCTAMVGHPLNVDDEDVCDRCEKYAVRFVDSPMPDDEGTFLCPEHAACGEPVAELGPCQWDDGGCGYERDDAAIDMTCGRALHVETEVEATMHNHHVYEGHLVHVTLGPCEECGEGESFPLHDECPDGPGSACDTDYHHTYAPTVTELPSKHEAEVSDG